MTHILSGHDGVRSKPRVLITSGEPAGIGPDLCLKASELCGNYELTVVGDPELFEQRAASLGLELQISKVESPDARHVDEPGVLNVLPVTRCVEVNCGSLNPENSPYVIQCLDLAVRSCQEGQYDALVTAPIHKGVINDAGIPFTGHTEYVAEVTGGFPVMMLANSVLRVALVTTHLPLAKVSAAITRERLEAVLAILHRDLTQRFAIENPRILVCGLNPHAGESGHLGREELDVIVPVIKDLSSRGFNLFGPLPADTAFLPKYLEGADVVLAMYHDQGLPVLKFAGFGSSVNVTLGLPIIRTSVDHGTALEFAGSGEADAGSMIAAVELAADLAIRSMRAGETPV